jgi:hypothetical protein
VFTEKHNTPKSLKIISNKFDHYFKLVTVGSVNKDMLTKFGVKDYPKVIVVPDPMNVNSGEVYEGDFNKKDIIKFLKKHRKPLESKWEELTESLI